MNLARLFRRTDDPAERPDSRPAPELERTLEDARRMLHGADAQTDRQWRLLHTVLQSRERVSAGARRPALRPAIAVGLVATAAVLALILPDWTAEPITHETARGQHLTITLADSTEVTLNHTSRLVVQNSPAEGRRVRLEGEAFFRVRSSGEPFVVRTDLGTVSVLGTEFNVRDRGDRLEVAVIRGSVRVASAGDGQDRSVVLHQGELTRFSRGEHPQEPVLLRYPDFPGWLHGTLLFERATLEEACREIENYFDVAVFITLPTGDAGTITGALDARTPEAALATLARLTGLNYRHDPSGYTLY